jgi:hypothetical protein
MMASTASETERTDGDSYPREKRVGVTDVSFFFLETVRFIVFPRVIRGFCCGFSVTFF